MSDSIGIFSRNLHYWLRKRGMTQAELARKMEVTSSCVSSWITGRSGPAVADYGRIAYFLGLSAADLFSDPDDAIGYRKPVPPPTDEQLLKTMAKLLGVEIRIVPKNVSEPKFYTPEE